MKPVEMPVSLEQEELRGLSRTVAEIEWLLLALVLLYQAFGGPKDLAVTALAMAMMFFAAFVLVFRYTNFYKSESRWKIAIETWVMIIFITWSAWSTGKLDSPLVNCYLLVIITSALALDKLSIAAEVIFIGLLMVFLGNEASSHWFSLTNIGALTVQYAPFILVAYVTTMFSADIRYSLSKARTLSETDELTGLLNRRAFATVTVRAFDQASRYKRPLSVMMIDSDGLKKVNDQYGHGAGDDLLRLLARCLQHELRTTDVPARQGGDEFVALLPETGIEGARDVAERVRRAVEEAHFDHGGEKVKTTVSIGLAAYPQGGNVLEVLLANADSALYKAKTSGRNKVVEYSTEGRSPA